jgi:hypothetical protein
MEKKKLCMERDLRRRSRWGKSKGECRGRVKVELEEVEKLAGRIWGKIL